MVMVVWWKKIKKNPRQKILHFMLYSLPITTLLGAVLFKTITLLFHIYDIEEKGLKNHDILASLARIGGTLYKFVSFVIGVVVDFYYLTILFLFCFYTFKSSSNLR